MANKLKQLKDAVERPYIIEILKKFDYNITHASAFLEVDRKHLYRKIEDLKIPYKKRGE